MFSKKDFILEWMDKFQHPTGYDYEVVVPVNDNTTVTMIARYLAYKTKEDFLFDCCMQNNDTLEQLSDIHDNLNLEERAEGDVQLVSASWRYESETHHLQLDMKDRVFLILAFMPFLRLFLKEGFGDYSPTNNLMVVGCPKGRKWWDQLTEQSNSEGQRQRDLMTQRIGLGPMKDCGWSFAKYGPELNLQPL